MSVLVDKNLSCDELYHLNGFAEHQFKESCTTICDVLREIKSENLRTGFTLEQKYRGTKDVRPQAVDYEEEILGFLLKTGSYDKLKEVTNQDLELFHVQIRLAYPESNFGDMSYMDWHRDSYYKEGKKLGFFPPAHKIIFYPKLSEDDHVSLKVIPGSHKADIHFDQTYNGGSLNNFDKSLISGIPELKFNHSNSSVIIFNTAILHGACKLQGEPKIRVVYSFVTKNQIKNAPEEHQNTSLKFLKLLEAER